MARKLVKINAGCGIDLYKDYINVDNFFTKEDLEEGQKTKKGMWQKAMVEEGAEFVRGDIHNLPFTDNYADFVLLDNVIEHIPYREVIQVFTEIRRVMKKGAEFKVITPDMDALALEWLRMSLNPFEQDKCYEALRPIVGGQEHAGEFHKCLFNMNLLNFCLVGAGFVEGRLMKCFKGSKTEPDGIGLREQLNAVYAYDWLVAIVKK